MVDVEKGASTSCVPFSAMGGFSKVDSALANFVHSKFQLPQKNAGLNDSFGYLSSKGGRPFLRIDGGRVDNDFMDDVYDLLTKFWQLPQPTLMIEVTGSAEEFTNLTPAQIEQLKAAVQAQVRAQDEDNVVWFVTGASDSGAMRLVGEAVANFSHVACLGVSTWANMQQDDRERLEHAAGRVMPYTHQPGNKKKLNVDHSCFLLADRGGDMAGQEIEFRNLLIDYVATSKFAEKIPVITILIGGGPNSLRTVDTAITAQDEDLNSGRFVEPRALILFKKTGRSADAIEYAVEFYAKNKNCTTAEFRKEIVQRRVIEPIIPPPWISSAEVLAAGLQRALLPTWSAEPLPPPYNKIEKPEEVDGAIEYVVSTIRNLAMRRHMISIVDAFSGTSQQLPNVFEIAEKLTSAHRRSHFFVENNFPFEQCRKFTKIDDKEKSTIDENLLAKFNVANLCQCGRDDHTPLEGGTLPASMRETRQVRVGVPHLCGTMKFVAPENDFSATSLDFIPSYSKFIRLYYKEPRDEPFLLQKVYALMTEFWRMPKPQLLIEITGTADDMRLVDSSIVKELKIGLIRVAKKARAWLVAGGTNCGVMKVVGDAVAEDRKTHGGSGVPCLGIATWGMLENRDVVFAKKDRADDSKVSYIEYPYKNDQNYVVRAENGNAFELNPGYDSYILVDTNKENRFGEEIDFRSNLLSYMADQKPYKSKAYSKLTPIVVLVIGGSIGTLRTVISALKSEGQRPRPCVLFKGFGGCSDFLALVSAIRNDRHKSEKDLENEVKEDPFFQLYVKRDLAKRPVDTIYQEMKRIWEAIFAKEELVTIVDMSSDQPNRKSVDDLILEALFKQDPAGLDKQTIKSWFELCLLWNRRDFAQKIIANRKAFRTLQKAEKKDKFVDKAVTFAIKRDQAKIFQLFVDSGLIDPHSYFIENERQLEIILHKLFWHPTAWSSKKCVSHHHLHFFQYLLSSSQHQLTIGPDSAYRMNYDGSALTNQKLDSIMNTVEPIFRSNFRLPGSVNMRAQQERKKMNKDKEMQFEMTLRDLFLLKLFLCRDEFAVCIWKSVHTSDYLGTALMASIYLEKLALAADAIHRRDLFDSYQELSIKWENRALAMIGKLAESQSRNLGRSLTRSLRSWHGINVLQMAYHGEKMRVMAHSAVQIELEKVWKGKWDEESTPKASFANTIGSPLKTVKTLYESCLKRKAVGPVQKEHKNENRNSPDNKYDIWTSQAVLLFYKTSPMAKFTFHSVFLMLFLFVLFGDVVVMTHEPLKCGKPPSIQMVLVWVCALMFTADAFQEIFIFDGFSADNVTTFTAAVFMLASFILRIVCYNSADTDPLIFSFARICYAISCIFFWFKCFRVLFVWKELGPKVLTFYEMFKSFAFFVILHFIVLFAFSAPIYALSTMPGDVDGHGNTKEYFALMARIIYFRWWQIVGINMDTSKDNSLGDTCTKTLSPADTPFGSDDNDASTSFFGNLTNLTTTTGAPSTTDSVSFCDFRRIVSSVLLMAFLLLTNIILLNMLIASFSHTVDSYREQAEQVWKFGRYHLIKSFSEKPVLPPPLNIFELLFINSSVFGRCKPRKWSTSLETYFNNDADSYIEVDDSDEKKWKVKSQLAKYRYREIDCVERVAMLKVLDAEEAHIPQDLD